MYIKLVVLVGDVDDGDRLRHVREVPRICCVLSNASLHVGGC